MKNKKNPSKINDETVDDWIESRREAHEKLIRKLNRNVSEWNQPETFLVFTDDEATPTIIVSNAKNTDSDKDLKKASLPSNCVDSETESKKNAKASPAKKGQLSKKGKKGSTDGKAIPKKADETSITDENKSSKTKETLNEAKPGTYLVFHEFNKNDLEKYREESESQSLSSEELPRKSTSNEESTNVKTPSKNAELSSKDSEYSGSSKIPSTSTKFPEPDDDKELNTKKPHTKTLKFVSYRPPKTSKKEPKSDTFIEKTKDAKK